MCWPPELGCRGHPDARVRNRIGQSPRPGGRVSEIEVRSITEQVAEAIRDGIRTGRFQPGTHHSAHTFAEALGVSRTPVREALVRLEEAGMVRFERNRGITILQPTVDDLKEIFQLRLMVEPPTAGRAALRMAQKVLQADAAHAALEELHDQINAMKQAVDLDNYNMFTNHDVRFHEVIISVAGNNRQRDLVNKLRDATWMLGGSRLLQEATRSPDIPTFGLPKSLGDVMQEHKPILHALENGDAQGAATAMYKHVKDTGQLLMQQLAAATDKIFDPSWYDGIPVPSYIGPVSDPIRSQSPTEAT
jgi:DNA-binding GntR family transcriptional regulator